MKNGFSALSLSSVLAIILLAGCSVGVVADAERDVERVKNDAADLRLTAEVPAPRAEIGFFEVKNAMWISGDPRRRTNGDQLPFSVERNGVTLSHPQPLTLSEIGNLISEATDIPVFFDSNIPAETMGAMASQSSTRTGSSSQTPDSTNISAGNMNPAAARNMSGIYTIAPGPRSPDFDPNGIRIPGVAPNTIPDQGPQFNTIESAYRAGAYNRSTYRVQYTGRLSNFLDRVSSHFNVAWKYEDGQIHFYQFITRTFQVRALPFSNDFSMSVSNEGGANADTNGGNTTSAVQRSAIASQTDMWSDIQDGLIAIVGQDRMFAGRSTGTITVTATPHDIKRVDEFIDRQNARLSKQVAISVKLLNVTLSDNDRFGLDLNSVFAGSGRIGIDVASAANGGFGGTVITSSLLGGGRFGGTEAVIEALSQRGDVSVVTSASVTTLSNVPVPIQVGTVRDYVPSITRSEDTDGNVTVETQTSSVSTGYNMQILPRVMTDGKVHMRYSLSTSELAGQNDGFDTITFEGQTLQLANVNNRSFTQEVNIPNGSTLVMSGFEQVRSAVSKSGTGVPENMVLGGRQSGSMEREIMVILITPNVLDVGNPIISVD